MVLLRRLLDAASVLHVRGSTDIDIRDIVYDSRAAGAGSVFVAMPSARAGAPSGASHAREAVERGAVAVVSQEPLNLDEGTTILTQNARHALADMAAEFYGNPSHSMHVFAVTGTDGKTTTTYLLEQILAHAGFCTGLVGTVEIKIADRRERNLDRMTTPESLDIQRLLRTMADSGVTHAALEASSHALALERLRACEFDVCALTNITTDHIEFHGSADDYFSAKASLFKELAQGRPAVLNRDDSSFERLEPLIAGPVCSYGVNTRAHVRATGVEAFPEGSRFLLEAGGAMVPCSIRIVGDFNVYNALAAASLALCAGVDLSTVAAALENAEPPPGRMQRVTGGDVTVVVDYAHTVRAFELVLSNLRRRTESPRRLIAVFGAAGDRDRAKRPLLARLAREYTDFFV
ncbi:MAG: UDP-N-acetylmuramoyl-L-alanyl-D-glutamate--2,6-diaminopimelate ligase, partial [Chloroflexi bacterium]